MSADAVRAAVRGAVGYDRMRALTAGFEVVETNEAGRDTAIYRFGPRGELIRLDARARTGDIGFDGRLAWQTSSRNPGVADPLSQRNREKLLTPQWVRGGWSLHPDAPFRLAMVDSLSDSTQVALSPRPGRAGREHRLHRPPVRPPRVAGGGVQRGPSRFVYDDYRTVLGFRIPHRVTSTYAGNTSVRRVVEVRPVAGPARAAFAVPPLPADHAFDPAHPAVLEVARARRTPTARRGTCSCDRGWTGGRWGGGTSTAARRG